MKLAHLVDSISRNAGGVSEAVFFLATALLKARLGEISVHAVSDRNSFEDARRWTDLGLVLHQGGGPRSIGWSPSLSPVLAETAPDLMHVHAIWQAQSLASLRQRRLFGTPYVVSPHGMLDPWALSRSGVKKRLAAALYENRHLKNASCLHALCEPELDAIRAYGLQNPVCLVPNGVNLPELAPSLPGAVEADGPKILLYLGRLHPKKNLAAALRAWASLEGRQGWRFAVAGWAEHGHDAELRDLCDELGLRRSEASTPTFLAEAADDSPGAGDLVFLGPVWGAEKDALLRAASAFALPSHSEGLPMAALEAWSYGLPTLMTPACNLPEGYAAGAALEIGTDVASIAEGMRTLLAMTDSERRSMGAAGRRLVEERFTWPRVAAQMKEVYEWVLGGGVRPSCLA